MSRHFRYGLLFIAACVAVGGALAAAARYSDVALAWRPGAGSGPAQRIVLSDSVFGPLAAVPSSAPSPTASASDTEKPDATAEAAPEPAPQIRPGSVFRAESRGSLSCRIPGGSDFLVEWDAAKSGAVAHFSGVRIPGALIRQRAAASGTLDNRIAISREEDGHSLSLTIDDGGAMRASVDGQESIGTCTPV